MTLDWDDLRYFLAVARLKTLVSAADHLQVTQSTVGRRLVTLQTRMNVRLFQKTAEGFVLTQAGQHILPNVEQLEAETLAIQRAVAGHDLRSGGLVRIASTPFIASALLAPCFAGLHQRHGDITIEAVPSHPDDEAQRDVDIMVQLRRFERHDQVMRRVGQLAFGLYAAPAYLARHGRPNPENRFAGHRMITLLQEGDRSLQAAWLAEHAAGAEVVLKVDSYETQQAAALHGGGLALLPCCGADAEPRLHRVAAGAVPPAEIWLGVRQEVAQIRRVRIVLDAVAEEVRIRAAALNPPELLDRRQA